MILSAIPMPRVDLANLRFDIFNYSSDRVTVVPFEKDKGGSGSTGTAMAVIEVCLWLGLNVHIVDLADTQLDLAAPYASVSGVTIHEVLGGPVGANNATLRAITCANPGDVVVVQFPGAAIQHIDRLHQMLVHVRSRVTLPIDVSIIWTMDRDQNSRDLLALTLDSPLPGPLHVNWPTWNGPPAISPALMSRIAAQGGKIFAMPALDEQFYTHFKADRIAPRTQYLAGDFVNQALLDLWLTSVATAIGAQW